MNRNFFSTFHIEKNTEQIKSIFSCLITCKFPSGNRWVLFSVGSVFLGVNNPFCNFRTMREKDLSWKCTTRWQLATNTNHCVMKSWLMVNIGVVDLLKKSPSTGGGSVVSSMLLSCSIVLEPVTYKRSFLHQTALCWSSSVIKHYVVHSKHQGWW